MDWAEVLDRFITLLQRWDKAHPSKYYSYYLQGMIPADRPELAKLIQEAVLSYVACKPLTSEE